MFQAWLEHTQGLIRCQPHSVARTPSPTSLTRGLLRFASTAAGARSRVHRGHRVEPLTGEAGSESMEAPAENVLASHGIVHRRVAFNQLRRESAARAPGPALAYDAAETHPAGHHALRFTERNHVRSAAARLAGVAGLVLAVSGMGFAFTTAQRQGAARWGIATIYRRLARLAYGQPNKRVIVQNRDDQRLVVERRLAGRSELVLDFGIGSGPAPPRRPRRPPVATSCWSPGSSGLRCIPACRPASKASSGSATS